MGEALSSPSALGNAQHQLLQTPEETGSSWAALVGWLWPGVSFLILRGLWRLHETKGCLGQLCLSPKEVEFTGNSISGLVLHQASGLYPSACLLLQLGWPG